MSPALFVTVLSPFTALPLLFGLVIGVWGSLSIIAGHYGFDLAAVVPWISVQGTVGAPIVLFVVAVFALARGQKMRDGRAAAERGTDEPPERFNWGPLSLIERACLAGAVFGAVALVYWIRLPLPAAWAAGLLVAVWFVWRKFRP